MQASGILLFCIIGLFTTLSYFAYLSGINWTHRFFNDVKNLNMVRQHFSSTDYLLQQVLQLIGFFIMITFKNCKDCFFCFSKVKNVRYSIFQIERYTYSEQMLKVWRNAWLLEAVRKINKKGDMLIDLDLDDYLNPQQTIDRHLLGVDMQFLVADCGGTENFSDRTSSIAYTYNSLT